MANKVLFRVTATVTIYLLANPDDARSMGEKAMRSEVESNGFAGLEMDFDPVHKGESIDGGWDADSIVYGEVEDVTLADAIVHYAKPA